MVKQLGKHGKPTNKYNRCFLHIMANACKALQRQALSAFDKKRHTSGGYVLCGGLCYPGKKKTAQKWRGLVDNIVYGVFGKLDFYEPPHKHHAGIIKLITTG